ncbi:hypothetical protein HBB16_14020 [Pseudonocardia sp. MCCB 268]|nr:hypothetical protein [Pseudonocardia cytotoxica]
MTHSGFPADDPVQADAAPAGVRRPRTVSATALDTGAGEVESLGAASGAGPSLRRGPRLGETTTDGAVGGDGSVMAALDAVPGSGPDALSGTGPTVPTGPAVIRGITVRSGRDRALAGMHGRVSGRRLGPGRPAS